MNEELKDWTESLGKKASDHEFCMICTKQINELKKENARLREIDEKALYALMFTRGYIGEQIWSDIDSEYEIIKKALERGE